jgi:ApaG protein
MVGSYGMETAAGERLDVDIPAFSLDSPSAQRTIN